jgi:hypothetical protein
MKIPDIALLIRAMLTWYLNNSGDRRGGPYYLAIVMIRDVAERQLPCSDFLRRSKSSMSSLMRSTVKTSNPSFWRALYRTICFRRTSHSMHMVYRDG